MISRIKDVDYLAALKADTEALQSFTDVENGRKLLIMDEARWLVFDEENFQWLDLETGKTTIQVLRPLIVEIVPGYSDYQNGIRMVGDTVTGNLMKHDGGYAVVLNVSSDVSGLIISSPGATVSENTITIPVYPNDDSIVVTISKEGYVSVTKTIVLDQLKRVAPPRIAAAAVGEAVVGEAVIG